MNPHKNKEFSEKDKERCPFYKKQNKKIDSPFKEKISMQTPKKDKKSETNQPLKKAGNCPFTKNTIKKNLENDFQGGGSCPMMGTEPNKRNPGFFIPEIRINVSYVSPFEEFLSQNNITNKNGISYKNWEDYPIYLKESVFYFGKKFDSQRNLEVGYKFFSSDELRERANEAFYKGDFKKSINLTTKALSFFKWLVCKPDNVGFLNFKNDNKFEEENKNGDEINENKFEDEIKEDKSNNDFKENKFKNEDDENCFLENLLFTRFHDKNIFLNKYHNCEDKKEREMEESILFNLYSNLSIYYLKNNNIQEAKKVIEDLEKLNNECSMFFFRKAQIISADFTSSIADLENAINLIKIGEEKKLKEEIYSHNEKFLKLFNMSNHKTIFEELRSFIEKRILIKKNELEKIIEKLLKKAKRIQEIEEKIKKRGLIPESGPEIWNLFLGKIENIEFKIIKGLLKKYTRLIEFIPEEDEIQKKLAYKEYQKIYKLNYNFKKIWFFEIQSENKLIKNLLKKKNQKFNLDLNSEKIQKRIKRIQREKSRKIIQKANIDLRMYDYVLQEIIKEEKILNNDLLEESDENIENGIFGKIYLKLDSFFKVNSKKIVFGYIILFFVIVLVSFAVFGIYGLDFGVEL